MKAVGVFPEPAPPFPALPQEQVLLKAEDESSILVPALDFRPQALAQVSVPAIQFVSAQIPHE